MPKILYRNMVLLSNYLNEYRFRTTVINFNYRIIIFGNFPKIISNLKKFITNLKNKCYLLNKLNGNVIMILYKIKKIL